MSKPDELQTIDTAALAQVSGGVAQVPPTTTTDPVLSALTDILDSLKTLTQQGSSSGGGGLNQQEMLMMFMVMQQRNQQAAAAAAAASAGAWWNQQPIVRYY
ncbi:MAG TPA: hypothetical protein VLM79_12280 [Kofleriaceae bacterium]|nr:hypothetical protein [Kofleriaceae bacterium]